MHLLIQVLKHRSFRYLRETIYLIKHPQNLDLLYAGNEKNHFLVDIGAFEGNFASEFRRINPNSKLILVEPIPEFYSKLEETFPDNRTTIINKALTSKGLPLKLYISDASTSSKKLGNSQEIVVESISVEYLQEITSGEDISLLQINCEGGEYDILPKIIETNLIKQIQTINIQYHYVSPINIYKRSQISQKLKKTHHRLWCSFFIWEKWERNAS